MAEGNFFQINYISNIFRVRNTSLDGFNHDFFISFWNVGNNYVAHWISWHDNDWEEQQNQDLP